MKDTTIKREHFAAMVEIAAELFGEDHSTTKALREASSSPHSDAIERGIAVIRTLPTAHRDHILSHAKLKMNREAKVLNWLVEKAGTPTDIPPGEIKH